MEHSFLKSFFLKSFILLAFCSIVVIIADPFFHYHKPLGVLKAVADTPEYQVDGSVRNFTYDSILLGSSVAENYNNDQIDTSFGCHSIKAIQKSASTPDLLYYLNKAYEAQELRYVFYSFDLFALTDDVNHVMGEVMPLYLYNENPIDDVYYLWNKDILFEKIPYMAAQSISGYQEGLSYNWARYKSFASDIALSNYVRLEGVMPDWVNEETMGKVSENLTRVCEVIKAHPNTQFYIMYPPYSELWWDNEYRQGNLSMYYEILGLSLESLSELDNAHIYYFQNETDIVCNLNLYMDPVHFSGAINDWMVEQMHLEKYLVTSEQIPEVLKQMKELVDERIISGAIDAY